jgi:hypothetical protein
LIAELAERDAGNLLSTENIRVGRVVRNREYEQAQAIVYSVTLTPQACVCNWRVLLNRNYELRACRRLTNELYNEFAILLKLGMHTNISNFVTYSMHQPESLPIADSWYLVRRYRCTLEEHLLHMQQHHTPAIPLFDVCSILADIANALNHCFKAGVLHLNVTINSIQIARIEPSAADICMHRAMLTNFWHAISFLGARDLAAIVARTPLKNNLAPEMRGATPSVQKQPTYELGLLAAALISFRRNNAELYPLEFRSFVRSLTATDPNDRPTIADAAQWLKMYRWQL